MITRRYSARSGTVDVQQLLGGQAVHPVVVHGGQVVGRAVGEGDDLVVAAVLGDLLEGAVHVADARVEAHHLLAVEAGDQTEHAVGAGVVRARR